jgi:gas vesicle protein
MAVEMECTDVSREGKRGGSILNGTGGILLGILTGAVVAGVAVLMVAPRTGKETRDLLRGKVNSTRQMIQGRVQDAKEKVSQIRRSMRSGAEREMRSVETE